jgi:hypothetical protein
LFANGECPITGEHAVYITTARLRLDTELELELKQKLNTRK